MPVSSTDVIDRIDAEPETNLCWLRMFEERIWDVDAPTAMMLKELEQRVNKYIDFIYGGQFDTHPELKGMKVTIALHVRCAPPDQVINVLVALFHHFANMQIVFHAFIGLDRSRPINLGC